MGAEGVLAMCTDLELAMLAGEDMEVRQRVAVPYSHGPVRTPAGADMAHP